MKICIDADACPVIRIAERIAEQHGIPCVLLCDSSHELHSQYSEIRVIGEGPDAVDFALINLCGRNDIVITQDYGVAAMALGRNALAVSQNGMQYTLQNIDGLLMQRHLAKKARRTSKAHLKGPAKRTEEDDERFAAAFERLLTECTDGEKAGTEH